MLGVRPKKTPDQRSAWIGPAPYVATDIPGPNASAVLRTKDTPNTPAAELPPPVVARRAVGSVIEDVDGNRFLDFTAALSAGPPGHAHPTIVAAVRSRTDTMSVSGTRVVTAAATGFAEKLASCVSETHSYRAFLHGNADRIHDAAVGLARRRSRRETILAFNSLGVTGESADTGRSGSVILDWPFSTIEFCRFQAQLDRIGVRKSDIAAIVLKPFATMRSCDLPDAPFAEALASSCQENGTLLIFDETLSGMGRTGAWFVCRNLGIAPDIVLVSEGLAGGMPLAALLLCSPLAEEASPPSMPGAPNPVCIAAASASLDVVASMPLTHVARLGEDIRARLERMAEVRKCVGQIAGSGLLQSIEVVHRKSHKPDTKRRNAVLRRCLDRGLLLAPTGPAGIHVSPAACINKAQLDVGCKLLEEALAPLP